MQLCANKLDKKDFFGKSDPFLVFYRSNEDGTYARDTPFEALAANLSGTLTRHTCHSLPIVPLVCRFNKMLTL